MFKWWDSFLSFFLATHLSVLSCHVTWAQEVAPLSTPTTFEVEEKDKSPLTLTKELPQDSVELATATNILQQQLQDLTPALQQYKQFFFKENENAPVTAGELLAYRLLLKGLEFETLSKRQEDEVKKFLLQQKFNYLKIEMSDQLSHEEKTIDKMRRLGYLDVDLSGVGALADLSWEGANFADAVKLSTKKSAPVNQRAVTLSPILNIGASGLGVGITLYQSAGFFKRVRRIAKLKRFNKKVKKNIERYSQQIEEEEVEDIVSAGLGKSVKEYLKLDRLDKEMTVKNVNSIIESETKNIKALGKSIIENATLSSTYFTASMISQLASNSMRLGIVASVAGGLIYGSFLAWVSAKGFNTEKKLINGIQAEIKKILKQLGELEGLGGKPKALQGRWHKLDILRLRLQLNNLKNYQKFFRKWGASKNAMTLGLGLSIVSSGAASIALAVGAVGAATAVAVSGYGVLIFLGGALVCSGFMLNKKYHIVKSIKFGLMDARDSIKSKFSAKDANDIKNEKEQAQVCSLQHMENERMVFSLFRQHQKRLKEYHEKQRKLLQKIDRIANEHNVLSSCPQTSSILGEKFKSLADKAGEAIITMNRLGRETLEKFKYQVLVEGQNKEGRLMARELYGMIEGLDEKGLMELAEHLELNTKYVELIQGQRKKKDFLALHLSTAIVNEGTPAMVFFYMQDSDE